MLGKLIKPEQESTSLLFEIFNAMLENELFLYKILEGNQEEDKTIASNHAIDLSIEQMFFQSGYDSNNFGNEYWNPLGELISPGQNVLIKPNMVLEKSHQPGENFYSVVTHPQIIKTITKYVYKALNGRGKITIADAPINSANFEQLCTNMGLYELQNDYAKRGFPIDLIDFRLYVMHKDEKGIITELRNSYDKTAYVEIKMDDKSTFKEIDKNYKRFRVTEYDPRIMPIKHNKSFHRYCFHKVALEANVVISLPKIKTHRKAGLTCAMKNLVGLNGNKDYLPHHTKFSKEEGGDEYLFPSFRKRIISFLWEMRWQTKNKLFQRTIKFFERLIFITIKVKPFRDNYFEGSWWGNQTISRTVCDLNRAILYADIYGKIQPTSQRKMFYLVDGIICGEGEGPMQATSKICNLLIWGTNAYSVDLLVAKLIGFEAIKMHTLRLVSEVKKFPISTFNNEAIEIKSNLFKGISKLDNIRDYIKYNFIPTTGWENHIEL